MTSPMFQCLLLRRLVLPGVLAGCAGLAPALAAQGADPLEPVGSLELTAPSSGTYIVRGTLPVPRGVAQPDRPVALALRSPDGQILRTQIEVVSRYPDPADGADVIELIARDELPAGHVAGDRLRYEVVPIERPGGAFEAHESVVDLMRNPESIVLRTRDAFGHEYTADLLRDLRDTTPDLRRLRGGSLVQQVRTHETLMPEVVVEGAEGTLPHHMGVHTYMTTWAEDAVVALDLRMHNGHEGRDTTTTADDPLGKQYFDELQLVLPVGWQVLEAFNTPASEEERVRLDRRILPLVAAEPGDKLHVLPRQAQFHRRLILYRDGGRLQAQARLEEAGLAFCHDGVNGKGERFWSWWNPETSRYWAQNLPLPDLSYIETKGDARFSVAETFDELWQAVQAGEPGPWPVLATRLGWAHPWGYRDGGAIGGAEIFYFDGLRTAWGGSHLGYRTYQLTHRMYTERHPTALYQQNGDPYHPENWIEEGPDGPYLPNWMFMVPWVFLGDPWGFNDSPSFQRDAVELAKRQPRYEEELLRYGWIDASHLIRYTRSAKTLIWLGNDAIARDDLQLQAELSRASYAHLPQAANGNAITTGLVADREHVDELPGDGFAIDRAEGWIIDTVASAYAISEPRWRDDALPWCEDVVSLVRDGQSDCHGLIMSKPKPSQFGGRYRVVQSISECILQNGLWGLRESVFKGAAPGRAEVLDEVLRRSTLAMISDLYWNEEEHAPHFYSAIGPFDEAEPPFCNFVPVGGYQGLDNWQVWNLFQFGFRLTADARFLERAADLAGGALTPEQIGQGMHPGELETRAGMISFLQAELGF